MSYFKDLSPCRYFDSKPYLYGFTKLLAVGWIDKSKNYKTGSVSDNFLNKLKKLYKEPHPQVRYCGWHDCQMCDENMGDNQLFIPSKNKIYVCPGGVDHYIEKHNYCPPNEFILAVDNVEKLSGDEYLKKIKDIDEIVYYFLMINDPEYFEITGYEIFPWAEKFKKLEEKAEEKADKRFELEKKIKDKAFSLTDKGKIREKYKKSSFKEKVAMLQQFFTGNKI
jgi:hypothetical protein